tara:strand:+ start:6081 stop:6773 length:693 start_codon:yes stop_codon:yes gene_type:complete
MISIVTGTLNRLSLLPNLIQNTVDSCDKLELVLVDGGSNDGTIEYLKKLSHPKIKLIEVGGRSSYPHFMNLGINNASHEWICQWNDDVLLVNDWSDVLKNVSNQFDVYHFNWKYGNVVDIENNEWNILGTHGKNGWCLTESVLNYGLYNKKIFREVGMYDNEFKYYYADGDMAKRSTYFGYKHKLLENIKVCSIITPKKALHYPNDKNIYDKNIESYKNKILPNKIEFLK